MLLHNFWLSINLLSQVGNVLHHLFQVVLHKVYSGLFELLKLLQIGAVFFVKFSNLIVYPFDGLLVSLWCYFSLILNSDTLLADLLDFFRSQHTFFMSYHSFLNCLFLFHCLFFEIKEFVSSVILLLDLIFIIFLAK